MTRPLVDRTAADEPTGGVKPTLTSYQPPGRHVSHGQRSDIEPDSTQQCPATTDD
jgi:hypothetical protein